MSVAVVVGAWYRLGARLAPVFEALMPAERRQWLQQHQDAISITSLLTGVALEVIHALAPSTAPLREVQLLLGVLMLGFGCFAFACAARAPTTRQRALQLITALALILHPLSALLSARFTSYPIEATALTIFTSLLGLAPIKWSHLRDEFDSRKTIERWGRDGRLALRSIVVTHGWMLNSIQFVLRREERFWGRRFRSCLLPVWGWRRVGEGDPSHFHLQVGEWIASVVIYSACDAWGADVVTGLLFRTRVGRTDVGRAYRCGQRPPYHGPDYTPRLRLVRYFDDDEHRFGGMSGTCDDLVRTFQVHGYIPFPGPALEGETSYEGPGRQPVDPDDEDERVIEEADEVEREGGVDVADERVQLLVHNP